MLIASASQYWPTTFPSYLQGRDFYDGNCFTLDLLSLAVVGVKWLGPLRDERAAASSGRCDQGPAFHFSCEWRTLIGASLQMDPTPNRESSSISISPFSVPTLMSTCHKHGKTAGVTLYRISGCQTTFSRIYQNSKGQFQVYLSDVKKSPL